MNSSIKQKIAAHKQKLKIAEDTDQKQFLEKEIQGLEDCSKNNHVYTERYSKENNEWKTSYRCHYCNVTKS